MWKILHQKFNNLPELAYGIYATAVTLSLGYALYLYTKLNHAVEELIGQNANATSDVLFDLFSQLTWVANFIVVTVVTGLVVVMPIIKVQAQTAKSYKKRADMLAIEATTDALTGLNNRRFFERALSEYLCEFRKIDRPLGLLILDLDHFKQINDNHGHDVGDIVLKEVANILLSLTREHDVVARIGGEEFAVIAPFASNNQIIPFANRFCKMIADLKIEVDNVVIRPTISIGVAISSEDFNDQRALIKLADRCLYEAKKRGRNQVCAG